jgi:hypothetical protein
MGSIPQVKALYCPGDPQILTTKAREAFLCRSYVSRRGDIAPVDEFDFNTVGVPQALLAENGFPASALTLASEFIVAMIWAFPGFTSWPIFMPAKSCPSAGTEVKRTTTTRMRRIMPDHFPQLSDHRLALRDHKPPMRLDALYLVSAAP